MNRATHLRFIERTTLVKEFTVRPPLALDVVAKVPNPVAAQAVSQIGKLQLRDPMIGGMSGCATGVAALARVVRKGWQARSDLAVEFLNGNKKITQRPASTPPR